MFSKLFFCLIFLTALTPLYSQEPLAQQLKSIIENKKATVGIAVLYNGKILVTVNDKAGYPMMSTFKFPLALAVLERLDKQGLPLETELFISKPDLHPDTYSPLREARPEGNFKITIGELLKYSVALSDNNACDILIDYLGGTSALQKYVRRQGIKQMKITATEDRMHKSGDPYLNHTRPSSAVRLLEKFIQQESRRQRYGICLSSPWRRSLYNCRFYNRFDGRRQNQCRHNRPNFKSSIRLYKRNIFVRCIVKPCLSVKPTYLTQMLSLWKTKKLS